MRGYVDKSSYGGRERVDELFRRLMNVIRS